MAGPQSSLRINQVKHARINDIIPVGVEDIMKRAEIIARRRRNNVFPGYMGIGEFHSGVYECDFVSPYSKSAQNLDADIMLVLQDWCSDEFLRKPVNPEVVELGHDPQLDTNRNLKSLLVTHFGIGLEETYATNLFPFIKPGVTGSGSTVTIDYHIDNCSIIVQVYRFH